MPTRPKAVRSGSPLVSLRPKIIFCPDRQSSGLIESKLKEFLLILKVRIFKDAAVLVVEAAGGAADVEVEWDTGLD